MQMDRFFPSKFVAVINSFILASLLAFLLSLHGTLPVSGAPKASSASSAMSNSVLKGDRLTSVQSRASVRVELPKVVTMRASRKVPIGCEAAFSRLVHSTNFSTRCVT